jgi:hypothetical protein
MAFHVILVVYYAGTERFLVGLTLENFFFDGSSLPLH